MGLAKEWLGFPTFDFIPSTIPHYEIGAQPSGVLQNIVYYCILYKMSEAAVIWEPLEASLRGNVLADRLGDRALSAIVTMGSTGNLADPAYESWRPGFDGIAETYDGVPGNIWSPEVPEWDPSMAFAESVRAARSKIVVVNIEPRKSPASDMEGGLLAWTGMLRGQEVLIRLSPADYPSRTISQVALRGVAQSFPTFRRLDTIEQLAHQAGGKLSEHLQYKGAGIALEITGRLPDLRQDLDPFVYLSGTSGEEEPEWIGTVARTIASIDGIVSDSLTTPVAHSHKPNWSSADLDEEWDRKSNAAVQLVAITGETESLGAMAEVGWRILHAQLSGQSFGIYVEPHTDSDPKSETNRTRTLLLEHLRRTREDFPDVGIYVAQSLGDLAHFGASELREQKQRMGLS